jgi:hypothetical protein
MGPVQMEEQKQMKYSYRFSVSASKPGEANDEGEKGEVQSYINELLGLEAERTEKNKLPA